MVRPILCLLALAGLAAGDNEELKLSPFAGPQRHLMVRPVDKHDDQLPVTFSLMLVDVDVDEVNSKATVGGWMYLSWKNSRLGWSGGSVARTRVMPDQMWTPDIYPYNMVPTVSDWISPTPALVSRSGEVIYVPPVSVTVRCHRKHETNPDRIVCPVKIGSWTYSTDQLDLLPQESSLDLTAYKPAGRWTLESSSITREDKTYPCCPESYVSLNAELVFVRSLSGGSFATCGAGRG